MKVAPLNLSGNRLIAAFFDYSPNRCNEGAA